MTAINFRVSVTPALLTRPADSVIAGRVAIPPIREVKLDDVPEFRIRKGPVDGKTVIVTG